MDKFSSFIRFVHLINRFIHLIYVKGCYFCEKFHSLNQFYKFKTKSK